MKYCFGVDVGGTTMKVGFFRADGNLEEKWEIKTRTENEGAAILPDLTASLEQKRSDLGIDQNDIIGIGMGIPAPVKRDGIIRMTPNLGWNYKEAKKELEELTGLPVFITNDANAAALGEMWKGAGAGHANLLMITLGTGVGGGAIVDGHILTGAHGAAAEIGHMHMSEDETDFCGCGNHGCLEQYSSATGMVRVAKKLLAASDEASSLRDGEVTAKSILDGVKAGDALCCKSADISFRYLASAIASAAALLDPEICVVGGGVSKAGQVVLDYLGKYYRDRAFQPDKDLEFTLATLGNDAGIYGAAKLILDEMGIEA